MEVPLPHSKRWVSLEGTEVVELWPWVVAVWPQGEPLVEAPKGLVGAGRLLLQGWVGQPGLQ